MASKPGTQRDLETFLDHGGFGTWEREVAIVPGRRFRADYFNRELSLVVEYDGMNGGAHGSVGGMMRDSEKLNLAQLEGLIVLRVNAATIRQGTAFAWIERAVALRRTEAGSC